MTKIYFIAFLILITATNGLSQVIDTFITFKNHKLHFKIIQGKNTPILFESGNGDDGMVWEPLLQRIYDATDATLITYDRAGLGKSGIDTSNISFKEEVKNLTTALNRMGYKNDFFLVAHSFGSFYASEFAQLKQGKIMGAVFIDTATPCGLSPEYVTKVKNTISEENWKLIREYKAGLYYVLMNFPDIIDYMSARFISNAIPLTVIAADIRTPTKEIGDTAQDMVTMSNCLEEFGRLPNHKYILAPNTEHKVWKKSPDLVTKEIIALYQQTAKSNN